MAIETTEYSRRFLRWGDSKAPASKASRGTALRNYKEQNKKILEYVISVAVDRLFLNNL